MLSFLFKMLRILRMSKKEYAKGKDTKITKNFSSSEFDCNCKYDDCRTTIIDVEHVEKLQELRDKWRKPIKITSAYRCAKHNADVGGATKSRHVKGDATDIQVKDLTPDQVADDCEEFSGLGRYNSFTHIDSRPGNKARWDFRGK
jgi:uncharacterized protein YcbK (DUF882 family)